MECKIPTPFYLRTVDTLLHSHANGLFSAELLQSAPYRNDNPTGDRVDFSLYRLLLKNSQMNPSSIFISEGQLPRYSTEQVSWYGFVVLDSCSTVVLSVASQVILCDSSLSLSLCPLPICVIDLTAQRFICQCGCRDLIT